jgi:DNA-binding transcriptional ArsR family regulator
MSYAAKPSRQVAYGKAPEPTARECIRAIASAQRRSVLRILHDAEEARSPSAIAEWLGVSVAHISYHFKVLRECGVVVLTDTQPRRGAVEHFYISIIKGNEQIGALLDATRAEDDDEAAGDR